MKFFLLLLLIPFYFQPAEAARCHSMTKKECRLFHEINSIRKKRGRPALRANARCAVAARAYAKELFERWKNCGRRKTRHYSKKYGSFSRRMRAFRVPGSRIGENLYCAPGRSVKHVAMTFYRSRGHRKNLLNRNYRSTGVGQYNGRWVQCFSSY